MAIVASGCSFCANPYDDSYAAYGGLRERTDMVHGRVGSVFDPAPEIIHEAAQEQSPQPAEPPSEAVPERPTPETPPESDGVGDESAEPDTGLPEIPNGTLELPDLEPDLDPGQLPPPDGLPEPDELPPDLSGNSDRSAWQHPLHDIFDEDF
jgi:hypothetical protein